jgi:hypothetical protein
MWRRKQQRPPATYEDVRRVAEVLSRFDAQLIGRHFAVSADIAQEFMVRLAEGGQFGDLQPDGWHYPLTRQQRLRRARAARKAAEKPKAGEVITDQPPPSLEDLSKHIEELEREGRALRTRVKRLLVAGKAVIDQREQWMARALAAEYRLQSERHRSMSDQRSDTLRRLIAKELHPDFCMGGDLEKLVRAECFKKLWPQIQKIIERE